MKFVTRLLCAATSGLIFLPSPVALADSFETILRNAAIDNGLLPAAQMFNDHDNKLADVGKLFFESKSVSLNGKMACRTCHLDEFGSADGLPNAVGIFGDGEGPIRALSSGKIVPRNTLPLWGRGGKGFDTFFWDGKVDFSNNKQFSQFGVNPPSTDALIVAAHLPPVEIREMISDDAHVSVFKREKRSGADALYLQIIRQLRKVEVEALSSLSDKLEKPMQEIDFLDITRSIAAFIRDEFRIRDTRFHRFVFGFEKLTSDELAGGIIFYGKGKCVNCHYGPYYSDLAFHAVPMPQLGFGKNGFGIDYGRFNITFHPDDLYRFRTPPLFNVQKTAPYGHSGSINTLRKAIIAHFDPLYGIDFAAMDQIARHEYFKRMAAVGNEYKLLSILSNEEVIKVEHFLKTLSF